VSIVAKSLSEAWSPVVANSYTGLDGRSGEVAAAARAEIGQQLAQQEAAYAVSSRVLSEKQSDARAGVSAGEIASASNGPSLLGTLKEVGITAVAGMVGGPAAAALVGGGFALSGAINSLRPTENPLLALQKPFGDVDAEDDGMYVCACDSWDTNPTNAANCGVPVYQNGIRSNIGFSSEESVLARKIAAEIDRKGVAKATEELSGPSAQLQELRLAYGTADKFASGPKAPLPAPSPLGTMSI
jgi:hypothetical protein